MRRSKTLKRRKFPSLLLMSDLRMIRSLTRMDKRLKMKTKMTLIWSKIRNLKRMRKSQMERKKEKETLRKMMRRTKTKKRRFSFPKLSTALSATLISCQ